MAYTAYLNIVEKIYIGYYQRPADPGGLIYWANQVDLAGGNLNTILPAFANSPEAQALYGTINSTTISGVVNQIYNAMFGRSADPGGLAYYVNGFNAGTFTAATIMLNVLNGAVGQDLVILNNKLLAADLFTRTIDPGLDNVDLQATYDGSSNLPHAYTDLYYGRAWLSGVTTAIPTQADTTQYIKSFIANPGDPLYNLAPVANNGSGSGFEDQPITGNVVATDADGDSLIYSVVAPPSKGVVTLNAASGAFAYTPNANFNGSDSFQYRVNDGLVNSNTATVSLTVTPVNDAPVAANSAVTTPEDTPVSGNVSATDVDNATLTYTITGEPSRGTVVINNATTGAYTYTPGANLNGSDSFTFTASDGALTSSAVVSILVTRVNDAPVANPAAASGNEDTVITGSVTASDIEGDPLTYSVVTPPAKGAVTLNADGTFSYTPNLNINGTDSFTYKVYDGAAYSNLATVSLTVTPVNDAPVALASAKSTNEDNSVTGNVSSTDVDDVPVGADPRTYTVTGAASNGAVVITNGSTGAYTYTPNPNFNGSDSFIFTAKDLSGATSSAVVSITVVPVNDAPVASNAAASGNEDTVIAGSVTASDIEGDTLTYSVVTGPGKGAVTLKADGAFSYTPNANFNGSDSFTYKAYDGAAYSNLATVTLTVTPVNDAPVAAPSAVTTAEDNSVTGNVSSTDVDDVPVGADPRTYTVTGAASNGAVVITNGSTGAYTYTPNPNFNGSDSFIFTAKDVSGATSSAVVSIDVTPVNDVPVAKNGSGSGFEDVPILGNVSASDIDGDTLNYFVVDKSLNGAVVMNAATGAFTYTPNPDYNGTDSFTYRVNDGTANSNLATVTLTVAPVNDAPVAQPSVNVTPEDTPVGGTVTSTDVDDVPVGIDPRTYSVTVQPAHGSVAMKASAYTYTPNPDFNGSDSFTFTAKDLSGATSSAVVSLTVTPVNDAPVATDLSLDGYRDVPISSHVTATDVDSPILTYSVTDPDKPQNGTVAMNADGTFTYTPDAGYYGADSFIYTVNDNSGAPNATDTGTVSLNIAKVDFVLTTGTDNFVGGSHDDIFLGATDTLNAGDSINGGGGNDTLFMSISGTKDLTYAGFTLKNVENMIVTADNKGERVTFDLSSSTGIHTLESDNSTGDIYFSNANSIPDGSTDTNLVVKNLTDGVSVFLDIRDTDVAGSNDRVNLSITSSDNNVVAADRINIIERSDPNALKGNPTVPSGVETVNLSTIGSLGPITITDLNTPGTTTLNIDTAKNLIVSQPLSSTVNYVDARFSDPLTGNITLDTTANNVGVKMYMGSGNDNITMGTGPDWVDLGEGNDTVNAGNGNNTVYGQGGNDSITTGTGDDSIDGGPGDDWINAGDGNNWVSGGIGSNDTIITGSGNDTIYGHDGNDSITFGSGNDFVDAGEDDDVVNAEKNLDSSFTENPFDSDNGGDTLIGGTGNDTLNISGHSDPEWNILDRVTGFENIVITGGAIRIDITDTSPFDMDTGTATTIDATALTGALTFNGNDLTPFDGWGDDVLSRAITVLGSDYDDTIITGLGADSIIGGKGGDSISSGAGDDTVWPGIGKDNVNLGEGNNTLMLNGGDLDPGDTITGGTGYDTAILVNDSPGGVPDTETAVLDAGVTGLEKIQVQNVNVGSDDGDVGITFNPGFAQPFITVDGSAMDSSESLIVDASANSSTENLEILGGAGNDWFNMGNNLGGDTIVGNDGWDTVQTDGTILDSAFVGVSLVEELQLTGGGALDNVTLGKYAQAAGIVEVDGTDQKDTVNAGAYKVDLLVYGFGGDDTITTGSGDDTIYGGDGNDVIDSGKGNDIIYAGSSPGDSIKAGSGDDQIWFYTTELAADDTIDGGSGTDTVYLSNGNGAVDAVANLDNISSVENFTAAYEDFSFTENDVSIKFINGNVATLTPINVSGADLTDGLDDFNVDLSSLGDADFAFNIIGGSGNDTVTGSDLAENLNFQGGAGDDWMNEVGGDIGTTVTMNGGADFDTINVTKGAVSDDSFVSISNVEHLTASTALNAQLGVKADAAGIISITGASGNDSILIDAKFNNPLSVNLSSGGDDSVNASASSSVITFIADAFDITSGDILMGGKGADDSMRLTADDNTAVLTSVTGVERFVVVEGSGGADDANIGITFNDGNFTDVAGAITVDGSALDDTGDPTGEGALNVNAGGITGSRAFNITGGTGSDVIITGSGADTINGGADNFSNLSNDSINSGAGNDSITTGAGNDTIYGGTGDDWINAGDGNNLVMADGNDTIFTGDGKDIIFAGDGADWVSSGGGNDQIAGDVVDSATGGNDTIDAGPGADTIIGGFGRDSITGGGGADVFMYTRRSDSSGILATSVDVITDFKSGKDVIDFRHVGLDTAVMADWNLVPGHVAGGLDGALIEFAGNAANFADAQSAVSLSNNKVDAVFQQDEHVLWVDLNDDGVLNNHDLRIVLDGVSTLSAADVQDGLIMGTVVLKSGDSFTGTIANDSVTIADNAVGVYVDGGAGNDTIMIGDDVKSVTVLGGANDDTIISGDDSADASTDSIPGTVFTSATIIDGGAGNDTLMLDHGDDISKASVSGIETVVLMHSTVTMRADQHNSFTNINDGDVGTADTINIRGGGVIIGDADVETYTVLAPATIAYAGEVAGNTSTNANAQQGNLVTSQLEVTGDADWFNTTLQAGHRYQIDLMGADSGSGTLSDPYVYLHDSAGTLLAQNDDSGTGWNSLLVFDATASGTYYVEARAYDDLYTGSYTLRVTDLGLTADSPATIGDATVPGTSIVFVDANPHTVNGGAANDTITGGSGNDVLNGGSGTDLITGGAGDDSLSGDAGNDTFVGADNNDTINGGGDTDTLQLSASYTPAADGNLGGVENVTVTGNALGINVNLSGQIEGFNITLSNKGDTVSGGADSNTITGGDGNDVINGGAKADTITGGLGNDLITGGLGNDSIDAGGGNDTIVGADNKDNINGGGDTDTLQLSADYTPFANSNLEGVENVTVTGNLVPVTINLSNQAGEAFNVTLSDRGDTITTSNGNDTITGGVGYDKINTGDGNNTVYGGGGWDTITGGTGDDVLYGGDGIDSIAGGDGNDTINGGAAADTLSGGKGDDVFIYEAAGDFTPGFESVDGGTGYDTLLVSAGANISVPDDNKLTTVEAVTLLGSVSVDLGSQTEAYTVTGSSGNDTITTGNKDDSITGGGGNDSISAGDGNDTIDGGFGDDTILGGNGADSITGGPGSDSMDGGAGNDTFVGADNTDTIIGGTGTDTLQLSASYAPAADGNLTGVDIVTAAGATVGVTINLSNQTDTFTRIIGSDYDDFIYGVPGKNDSIFGGSGNDTIVGFSGTDTVDGGGGTNVLQMSATSADLTGAPNANLTNIATVDFSSAAAAVTVNLGGQFEAINIIGSGKADTITAAGGGGIITGGGGADTITAGAGADIVKYLVAADSQGLNRDQVNGFVSGPDKIDISAIAPTGTFIGNAANDMAAAMALTGVPGQAVFSDGITGTSTLFVDVNGDGFLTNADLAVKLAGVATLAGGDIKFV